MSKGQAREIAYFLKSRVKQPYYATPMQIQAGQIKLPAISLAPKGRELAEGERLLFEKQCLACHQFREFNGRIAPDLSFIGSQRQRSYLDGFLDNPARYIPGAVMPQVPMTTEEKTTLVDYLSTQAVAPENLSQMLAKMMGQEEPAKQLFMRLCQACHAAEGNGLGPIQPNLANFPRAFAGNADFFRRIEQKRLLTSIEKGIPGTSMPGYEKILSPQQRQQVMDLIFAAFIGIGQNDKAKPEELPQKPVEAFTPQDVDSLFTALCSRCHGDRGNGKGTEALQHLPRPRNLTNHLYFTPLPDERIARAIYSGIPGTVMPAHAEQLSAGQLWGLVGKIRQLTRGEDAD
jgi:mono/diheme cytochrome c family protein